MTGTGLTPSREVRDTVTHLRTLARALDESFTIPGTTMRIGIDPLIGLIPGVGDAISALLSAYIVLASAKAGAPAPMLVRMAFNVLLDTVGGSVPIVGDLFDAGWKSNVRNVRLLEQWAGVESLDAVVPERPSRRLIMVAVVAGGLALVTVWLLARYLGG